MDSQYYWKPLSKLLKEYINHKESKSEGNIGLLSRKRLSINGLSIRHIGKESNELNKTEMIGVESSNYTEFINMEAIILKLLCLSPKEARKIGISKPGYYEILKKYKDGKAIVLRESSKEKLLAI